MSGVIKTNNGVLIPAEWAPFVTQYTMVDPSQAMFELIHKPQWYVRTYTDNVTTVLNYFDAALATEDLFTAVFPLQESYLLKAFGIYIRAGIETDDAGAAGAFPSMIRDVQLLINTGVFDITIGRKNYGPFRQSRMSAGAGAWGALATAGAEAANLVHDWGQVGEPNPDAIYKLAIPLVIPAQTQCRMALRWPAGAVNLTADRVIELMLEGITASPVQ